MLVALSAIAADQASPTKNNVEKVDQLLDYAASQEDAVITYHASDMVLAIHSDASYSVEQLPCTHIVPDHARRHVLSL